MDSGKPANDAQLLAEDPIGVERETSPRTLQKNGENSFYTYLAIDWLRQLNSAAQGEPVYHSLSAGRCPIIVTEPAIIVQPIRAMSDQRRQR